MIDFANTIQIASKLTPKKLSNAWDIWYSYQRALKSQNPSIQGLPISMSVEPTTSCNLQCPECPSGLRSFTRPRGKLSVDLFEGLLSQVKSHLCYLNFYFQGEPFLHQNFLTMVQAAHRQGVYTNTSTNAHFLEDERAKETVMSGLDRIIISIDGATQSTYEAYRKGGDLPRVLEGTKKLLYWRKKLNSSTPRVVWQFLVVKPNEHEIPHIKQMAKEYGVDKVLFKTAQVYDFKNGNELIPTNTRYARYKKNKNGFYSIKNKLEDKCWKMWHSCVITWDGQVLPCCFDKDAKYSMGSLSDASLQTIWNAEPYRKFRSQLLNGRKSIDICQNCTEGLKVFE